MKQEGAMRSALAVLLAVLLAAVGGIARADQPVGERELTVGNRATQAIDEIYVSPSSADHWGDDQLGEATLPPGRTQRLKLGRLRDCEFDVQVVYEDGSREESKAVNVCRTHLLAFDGSGATAPAQAPARDVEIANRAGRPIQQVLISPTDAGDWGEDRLGNTSISVGEAAVVHYRGDCVADIRVVFDNRGAEERRAVDLCASRRIAVQPGWTTADVVPTEAQPGDETLQLTVSNGTGQRVEALYLFPDGSARHGPELLGSAGLAPGASVTIAFARPAATCRFAAHVVFGAGPAAEDVAGLDLCHSPNVVLPAR
jgi:hypothetical protein